MTARVLYEDNHVIVVHKPAGMLVQGDATGDRTLMDVVKEHIKHTHHKTGNVFLGLVHRLDRPVAGVIVFAKTSKAAARLSEQFRTHAVTKIYHALVHDVPRAPRATLIHFLKKDPRTNTVTVFDAPHAGAVRAELSYEVVATHASRALLKIFLRTGRPHQIRSQLAHIGHPIVGDVKYAPHKHVSPRMPRAVAPDMHTTAVCLAATTLTFSLPVGGAQKTITIPIPPEWRVVA